MRTALTGPYFATFSRPLRKREFDEEDGTEYFRLQPHHQLERRPGGAARGEKVVRQQDALARVDRVLVHLQRGGAVFQRILHAAGPPWELALLPGGNKAAAQPRRQHGPEDEPARVDAHDLVHLLALGRFRHAVDRQGQEGGIRQHRGDVLEEDAGLREVRHVSDGGAESGKRGCIHEKVAEMARHAFTGWRMRKAKGRKGDFHALARTYSLCHIIRPMELTRLLLLLSTIAFVGGLVHAIVAIRAGAWKESRWHLLPMAVGFGLQCAFLYLRGQAHGRCPLTNLFEVFIFIGWCIVLLYFLVGTTYRLSLLGVFTAPLVALLQTLALLYLRDETSTPLLPGKVNPWLELHASVALIGYAAFALACITGVMFLMQDFLLKRHRIHALFHQLPPIQHLVEGHRSPGRASGCCSSASRWPRRSSSTCRSRMRSCFSPGPCWRLYGAILLIMWRRALGARHTAWLAVVGFLVPFVSLWIVTPKPQ